MRGCGSRLRYWSARRDGTCGWDGCEGWAARASGPAVNLVSNFPQARVSGSCRRRGSGAERWASSTARDEFATPVRHAVLASSSRPQDSRRSFPVSAGQHSRRSEGRVRATTSKSRVACRREETAAW